MNKFELNLPKIYAGTVKAAQLLLIVMIIFSITFFLVARGKVNQYTRRFSEDLAELNSKGLDMQIRINDTIPVELEIPVNDLRNLFPSEIPFSATVPIRTTVRIRQNISVPVNLPLIGRTIVELPIDTSVPISQDIPVSTTISLDTVDFAGEGEMFHLATEVPVNMPLRVNLTPADLGLDGQMETVDQMLNTIRSLFLLRKFEPEEL